MHAGLKVSKFSGYDLICANLVNTHTDRHRERLTGYTISSANPARNNHIIPALEMDKGDENEQVGLGRKYYISIR